MGLQMKKIYECIERGESPYPEKSTDMECMLINKVIDKLVSGGHIVYKGEGSSKLAVWENKYGLKGWVVNPDKPPR